MQITDATGLGDGPGARVKNNNLHTFSITESRIADISKTGYSFLLATDFVSLTTTGSFNGIMYIKNTDSNKSLFIDSVRVCGDTTGNAQIRYLRNPTAGTLISDANDADQLSANAGSNIPFPGLAYSASGDGKTVTDGDSWSQYIQRTAGHSSEIYNGAIIIPNGSSLAISAKPSVAMTLCMAVQCWFEEI